VSLRQITLDSRVWPRARLDGERVELFAELIADAAAEAARTGSGWSDPLPPLVVVADGLGGFMLGDGWHRYEARRRLGVGFDTVTAEVHWASGQPVGERAYWLALSYATRAAKPLTTAEKRGAIERLLGEHAEFSDREIARLVGVAHATVGAHRARLANLTTGSPVGPGGADRGELRWRVIARRLADDTGELLACCRKLFGGPDFKTAGSELYHALAQRYGNDEAANVVDELSAIVDSAQLRARKVAAR
jgi:hypothetical protein